MEQEVELFLDESVESTVEKLQWYLMEFGIKIEKIKEHPDYITYRLCRAEPLNLAE